MSLNLRGSGNPLTQNQVDGNFTFLYNRDITGSTVSGTTLLLYKQDGTVLATQLTQTAPGVPVNSVQFNGGNNIFSGSSNFIFNPSTNNVSLNGSLSITGTGFLLTTQNTFNGGVITQFINYSNGSSAYSAVALCSGIGGYSISSTKFLFTTGFSNSYIRNTELTTIETVGAAAGGSVNSSIPTKQINFIASQNSDSLFEWHYNTSNTLTNAGTAKMILSANTGNLFTSGSYSTTAITLRNTPTLNNSNTQILVRNSTTGNIEYRDASTISGGTSIDTFTTGFTYSNNNLTISRNQGQPALTVTINNFTGLTINGAISATTYLNLPPFTGNTSASCINDLYISNLHGCSPITVHDSIQSIGSISTGLTSFAFGNVVTATGDYSHAEGISTQSIGFYSHAEGQETISNGSASHAEGQNTTATGDYSHAEGISTESIGVNSHAEGEGTVSTGNYSHAEGRATNSIGLNSHAEGNETTATGNASHAEGQFTNSIGVGSHAEGVYTTATGESSHSQGSYTNSIGIASFASGSGSTASGITSFIHSTNSTVSGDRSVVLGGKNINGTQNDFVYVSNLNINDQPVTNTGTTSQVLVRNTTTGNVEVKNIGNVYFCFIAINSSLQPQAGIIPSVPIANGGIADRGRFITGFTTIVSNSVISQASGAGNYVTSPPSCSFGTFNNNTGVFTFTQAGLYLVEGAIHLKSDNSSSVFWQTGTTTGGTSPGTFGLGFGTEDMIDLYGGNYMTVIPEIHSEIDVSISNLIYTDGAGGNDYVSLKYLNWTNRNYNGTTYTSSDVIRFSITKVY